MPASTIFLIWSSVISDVGRNELVVGYRVYYVLGGDAAKQPLVKRLDYLAALYQRGYVNAVDRAAVVRRNYNVLRDVHEPAW